MSSTNKTARFNLNQWLGRDKPSRTDFNNDNVKIENAIVSHIDRTDVHTTPEDRDRWDNNLFFGMYFGTGDNGRVISTKCPFEAKLVIVFACNRPAAINNYDDSASFNYFGIGTQLGNMLGLTLNEDGRSFVVAHSSMGEIMDEYMNLNEYGQSYIYFMMR